MFKCPIILLMKQNHYPHDFTCRHLAFPAFLLTSFSIRVASHSHINPWLKSSTWQYSSSKIIPRAFNLSNFYPELTLNKLKFHRRFKFPHINLLFVTQKCWQANEFVLLPFVLIFMCFISHFVCRHLPLAITNHISQVKALG